MLYRTLRLCLLLSILPSASWGEAIVITGNMVRSFIGKPVDRLRIVNHNGVAIPFQIDEVTTDDDYVCPGGSEPNAGNGILDTSDEIVFLWEDADTVEINSADPGMNDAACNKIPGVCITVEHGSQRRYIDLVDNPEIQPSPVSYVKYDEKNETVATPHYYAVFSHDRFSFIKAGVRDFSGKSYIDLTNELRISIYFRALWGLLPISYSEENMICLVKRYKAGPIRLIRRGDFHLNLGLWINSSHAAVNQLCYPDMVRVPVYVHLPVRFRSLFGQAYIEMTPVIKKDVKNFSFRVPKYDILFPLDRDKAIDSLVCVNPNHGFMAVDNGATGYGWLLDANMQEAYLDGSGYVFHKPSSRSGLCDCGFRLAVRDLPKGNYLISNWVLFSGNGAASVALETSGNSIRNRAEIKIRNSGEVLYNQLTKNRKFKKN